MNLSFGLIDRGQLGGQGIQLWAPLAQKIETERLAVEQVLDIEQDVRQVSRQSLVLRRTVRAGDRIKEADLTVQRPGTGISAALFVDLVGRRVSRNLTAGSLLQWDMFEAMSDAA